MDTPTESLILMSEERNAFLSNFCMYQQKMIAVDMHSIFTVKVPLVSVLFSFRMTGLRPVS